MKKIHFFTSGSEKIGLLFEDNQCIDIYIDRPTNDARLGAIYKGKVRNVDESMEAAFIDIGLDKVGFLPKSELPFIKNTDKLSSHLIDGASIIVQIIKEPYQDKGPRLSANITITGKYLIYLPKGNYIASSKKLTEAIIDEWKSFLTEQLLTGEGVIMRTGIANATQEEVVNELVEARERWQQLIEQATEQKRPSLLFEHPLIPDQMMNQYQKETFKDITFDERQQLERMKKQYPHLSDTMRIRKEADLIAGKNISEWLMESIQPVVRKVDGITLIIEQTEALTVIDIDSSKFTSRQNKQHTVFHINQRSVEYCIEEIRKRNISGIIMIDFLKMSKKEEAMIVKQMRKALREDPTRTEVLGFTKLGLLEMTRKRERTNLKQLLTDRSLSLLPVLSTDTIGYKLERELLGWNSKTEALLIAVNPDLFTFMKEKLLDSLLAKFYIELYYFVDPTVARYEIIRSGSKQLIEQYIVDNQEKVIDKLL